MAGIVLSFGHMTKANYCELLFATEESPPTLNKPLMEVSSGNGGQPLRNETAVIKDDICESSCKGTELTN